jgi:hypothetical protein
MCTDRLISPNLRSFLQTVVDMKPGKECNKLFFRFLAFGVNAGWKLLEFTLEHGAPEQATMVFDHACSRNVVSDKSTSPSHLKNYIEQLYLPRFHVGASVFYRHVDGDSLQLIPVIIILLLSEWYLMTHPQKDVC